MKKITSVRTGHVVRRVGRHVGIERRYGTHKNKHKHKQINTEKDGVGDGTHEATRRY